MKVQLKVEEVNCALVLATRDEVVVMVAVAAMVGGGEKQTVGCIFEVEVMAGLSEAKELARGQAYEEVGEVRLKSIRH